MRDRPTPPEETLRFGRLLAAYRETVLNLEGVAEVAEGAARSARETLGQMEAIASELTGREA